MMKGKTGFTAKEIEKICRLIDAKIKANPLEQKRIRNKIRGLGFYYSDYSNKRIPGGYT